MTSDTLQPVTKQSVSWRYAALPGLIAFLLTLLCLQLILLNSDISPLWFPSALMTVLVFRLRAAQLALALTGSLCGVVTANFSLFGISISSVIFPLLNLLHALLAGLLLRRLLNPRAPLHSLTCWGKLILISGLFAPLLTGALALVIFRYTGEAASSFIGVWVLSEIIGTMALAPVALLWRRDYVKQLRRAQLLETLLTLAATLILSYVALHYLPSPFTFIVVILFWCAVRLPRFEAFTIFLINLVMLSLQLSTQYDHTLSPASSSLMLSAPWLPFMLALIPCQVMTLVMSSFREEKKHISESETRFRHAMEYSTIGMALVAPSGKWLQVNKSLCRLLGYPPEQLLRLDFQQVTHPDDLHADLRQFDALLQGDIDNYTLEKRYLHRDGHIVWVLLAVSLVRDDAWQPLYLIAQIEDITELKRSEQINQRLMERITLANEAGGIGVWEWNVQTGEMNWDKRMFEIYEVNPSTEPNYALIMSRILPDDKARVRGAIESALTDRHPLNVEHRIETFSGVRYLRTQAQAQSGPEGQVTRMLGIVQDISQLSELNEALFQEKERMQITLDSIGEAVISTDEEMSVTFMNPVAEKMSGWTQADAAGKNLATVLHVTRGRSGPVIDNLLLCDLPGAKSSPNLEEELVLHSKSGSQYDIHYSITPLKTLDGNQIGSVMVINDVSASREMMKRLSYSASHDMLTRLPNRMNFELQLKRLLLGASEFGQQHVLAFVDLDRFKSVNDTAGHAAGDALLCELAALMLRTLRTSDFLARLGGDEFGILLPDCTLEQAREGVQRIVSAINHHRFIWEGRLYRVGASAGLTLINAGNHQASEVLTQADIACYNAKHRGRGQIAQYEQQQQATRTLSLSQEQNAWVLRERPLRFCAWPVSPPRLTDTTSLWLTELRLIAPDEREIDEASFRRGLQSCALQVELDRKVIHTFFSQFADGVAKKGITLSLPLSAAGLRDKSVCQDFLEALRHSTLCPTLLLIAVQLDAVLEENPLIHYHLQQLKALGCRILVTAFGRNLEAFSQLRSDQIDYLSLNPELVANIHCNLMDEMMASIIHGHAQRLNMTTLAGPVDLPATLTTLSHIGVEGAWGSAIGERRALHELLAEGYFAIR
ncbi:diguanylate cyclase [Pantoea sp. 1.19]|uniref:diguanylate cyclase n=1 Tax=Pantoea sp. 1.19 TaxID=1925589 RepID=UPI000948DCDF|nr:diguanylate cyclase [Pantoea sp. 1.19]